MRQNIKTRCNRTYISFEAIVFTLLFIIPRTVLLSSIHPEAETLDFLRNALPSPGGDSTLIRRVCATSLLNLSPCSGVGKPKKDTLFWSYCSFLKSIVLYCIVLYCISLHCIVLYCIVLYCIVLYCIVLYCIVLEAKIMFMLLIK